VNTALRRRFGAGRIPSTAFLLGAVLPDIPLFVLWTGAYLVYRYALNDTSVTLMDARFDAFYFTNPFWIVAHNLLHGPLVLLSMLALLWRFRAAAGTRSNGWFWFFAGCLIHTALDIPTHVDDGPLLLFPFNWNLRFNSPVSYWDRRYYGEQFALFELILNIVLIVYLAWPWVQRRLVHGSIAS
jgi:membrane-bound metal-dependent hydrolase YbcI (DUF457 family)